MSRSLKLEHRAPSPPLRPVQRVDRYIDNAQCLIWFGNVQILLSRQPPTREFMRRMVLELKALSKECNCGAGTLLIIRSDVAPPSEEARAYIREELSDAPMFAAAQVVLGKGFVGAAMRSVLSVIQLMSRPPYPMKIFSEAGPAATWLTRELSARTGQGPNDLMLAQVAKHAHDHFLAEKASV